MSSQPLFHVTAMLQGDTSYKSGAREGLQIIQTFTYDAENQKDGSKADRDSCDFSFARQHKYLIHAIGKQQQLH